MKKDRNEENLRYLRDTDTKHWLIELNKLGRRIEGQMYLNKIGGGKDFSEWLNYAEE